MKVPSIFEFERFSPYFAAYFEWRKSVDTKFSYRWLERRIESASYSMLAMIATGRRLPSVQLLKELAPILNLEEDERQFAELLVELERSHNPSTREMIKAKLEFLKPSDQNQQANFDMMMFLGDWYHTAILEMFNLTGFVCDPDWISAKLGGLVSAQQVVSSLELLRRLELLVVDSNTGNYKPTGKSIDPNLSHSKLAIRNFHKQFLDLAKDNIMTEPNRGQLMKAGAISIALNDIPKIRKEIEHFFDDLKTQYASKTADATFQLSMQMLQLTVSEPTQQQSSQSTAAPIDQIQASESDL